MRGHIVKRGKDSYTIVLSMGYDPVTGKYKQQWVSVKGTKKDAEHKLAEMLHQIDTGGFVKPGKVTVAEFLERWLDEYVRPNLAPRTTEGYEHIIRRHIIPRLGSILLTQLKSDHLQKYYADLQTKGRLGGKSGLSPRTVRYVHVTLHAACKSAVRWGLLSRNPADTVDPPRHEQHEMHILDEPQVKALLEAARSTPYYALFYLALYTGMRRSELLALRWCDIDLILGEVSVARSLHRLKDGRIVFGSPKTAKGRRMIALPPTASVVLRNHREQQKAIFAILGRPLEESDLVFCQTDGHPTLPDTVTHAWIKLVRRVGLEHIRLHDLRHTHASLMLKQGIHPKIVQERLGHASIGITLDTYSHVVPGLQAAAAARFDQGLRLEQQEFQGEKEPVKK